MNKMTAVAMTSFCPRISHVSLALNVLLIAGAQHEAVDVELKGHFSFVILFLLKNIDVLVLKVGTTAEGDIVCFVCFCMRSTGSLRNIVQAKRPL